MAKTVDELLVYQKARAAAAQISWLLERTRLAHDRILADQLNKGSVRVLSDIAEGFEQKTDKGFAKYLYDAKGGAQEIRTQLDIALIRKHVSAVECEALRSAYLEVARMLGGLIAYLETENRSRRRRPGR